jgi:hypothetical protein
MEDGGWKTTKFSQAAKILRDSCSENAKNIGKTEETSPFAETVGERGI